MVLTGALLISSLAGCTSAQSDNQTTSNSSQQETNNDSKTEKKEIVFWHNWSTGPSGESMKKSVEELNKTHPEYVVKPVYVATDGGDSVTSKLLTAVAGGNPPDAMLASRYGVAEYMDAVTILNDRAETDGITKEMFYSITKNILKMLVLTQKNLLKQLKS